MFIYEFLIFNKPVQRIRLKNSNLSYNMFKLWRYVGVDITPSKELTDHL